MLTHIHIENFVIVKSLSLDFQNGLHVLTGETGAGKSIWVDALQMGLGERADSSVIFENADFCDITLCFDLSKLEKAKTWLRDQDLCDQDECIIRRVIHRSKPSRTTINGVPTPQSLVKQLAQLLLCVHSQHQHQRLLQTSQQRHLLDHFANNEKLLTQITTHYNAWKTVNDQLQQLQTQAKSKSEHLSLWQYQLAEIQDLSLQENEFQEVFKTYQQLHHAKQTIGALNEALQLLDNEQGVCATTLLSRAQQQLQSIQSPDSKINDITQAIDAATIQVNEASDTLSSYCSDMDFQLSKLDQLEQRLNQIQDIARKHHIEPEQLPDIQSQLASQVDALENIETEIAALQKQQTDIETNYQSAAKKLTAARTQYAKRMSDAITERMQNLGMKGGLCNVVCEPLKKGVHPHGNESIVFHIATNPGQTPHALSHAVSGGELSRLSLIAHLLTAQASNTPTLIFDEVDVGIGGKTADIVGQLLRELGEQAQVLCITHLPQVAAKGHHHHKAEKITSDTETTTTIKPLNDKERTAEIARMLSGATITEKSLLHANELLATITT